MTNQAALLFLSGPLSGKGKKIKNEVTVIGRSSSCDICIADASISREHAKITLENGVFTIKDLGSHNGIKVNDSKVDQLVLKNGSRFRLGAAEIEFWDGAGAPPALQGSQDMITPPQGNVLVAESGGADKPVVSNVNELKQKRITNIVILISILLMATILIVSVFVLMNKKERPVHNQFVKMYTDEDRVVDLNFMPLGESEKFLEPFVVHDYSGYTAVFKNIILDKDITIIKGNDIVPPIKKTILLRTKFKTGQGEITFYIDNGKEKRIIGVLQVTVVKRVIPEVLDKYINASLETKISIAEDMYQQAVKFEEETNKIKDVWNLLKNSKSLFENGEAKPEIYTRIDKKFSELNKIIERNNKLLFSQFDLDCDKQDYISAAKKLEQIILKNPDEENLYRQKAVLNSRRIKPLLK